MPDKRIGFGSLLPLLIIIFSFAVLALLPALLRPTKFTLSTEDRSRPLKPLPMDMPLKVVRLDDKRFAGGTQVSLKELTGGGEQTLLVNFWATWCPPCIDELPSIEDLHRQFGKSGSGNLPRLVAISVDEKVQDIVNLDKTLEFRPTFIVLSDPGGKFAEQAGTRKFPETYWVDAQGKVLEKWVGPQNWLSADVLRTFNRALQKP